ncbi:hypothetical protein AGMMS49940_13480 [Spirochaetia bacterium]|nr:hypothetical protein AGMMS49940_13480 [Spirochaetia bacterium]
MTIWDFLHNNIPLWFATPAFLAAAVGFCCRGLLFFKFGFGNIPDIPLDVATKADLQGMATKKDIQNMATKADLQGMATKDDLQGMATKDDIVRIETNHFAHLNKFLDLLCGILQEKNILTSTESVLLKQTLKD